MGAGGFYVFFTEEIEEAGPAAYVFGEVAVDLDEAIGGVYWWQGLAEQDGLGGVAGIFFTGVGEEAGAAVGPERFIEACEQAFIVATDEQAMACGERAGDERGNDGFYRPAGKLVEAGDHFAS